MASRIRIPARERSRRPPGLPGHPRIWAIGGGKGGVGKSVIASSLAAAIAGKGRHCALIDADLGGANLHSLLGVAPLRRTLADLLTGEAASLAELMVPTSLPNLSLVSGDRALLEMANPKHCQKEKLFRQIRGLDVDDVVLDLGAGSAFNTLDFFLLAKRKLVVVTPEPTALENAEQFIRAALYRSLRAVARHREVGAAIRRLHEARPRLRVGSAGELIARVRQLDPSAAKLLAESAQAFLPILLVNRVSTVAERSAGQRLVARCREHLGAPIELAGCIESDPNVPAAVARRQAVFQAFPHCAFSRSVASLTEHLLRDEWDASREQAPNRGRSRSQQRPTRSLPTLDPAQPGAYLRRCRETLGLSLRELTERTCIRVLDHIEAEHFAQLPPEPYLRGYLLSYGQELGVPDLPRLVACYLGRDRDANA